MRFTAGTHLSRRAGPTLPHRLKPRTWAGGRTAETDSGRSSRKPSAQERPAELLETQRQVVLPLQRGKGKSLHHRGSWCPRLSADVNSQESDHSNPGILRIPDPRCRRLLIPLPEPGPRLERASHFNKTNCLQMRTKRGRLLEAGGARLKHHFLRGVDQLVLEQQPLVIHVRFLARQALHEPRLTRGMCRAPRPDSDLRRRGAGEALNKEVLEERGNEDLITHPLSLCPVHLIMHEK